ncbi:MAG: HAMP domain-containing protein [Proteobacteria bacterium]|nr:HAMP domain-containing protein [Pseudomonadota bacterium]
MFSLKTVRGGSVRPSRCCCWRCRRHAAFALLNDSGEPPADRCRRLAGAHHLGVAILGTAQFAFLHGRRIARRCSSSTDRYAHVQGDFTQPVLTLRRDELSDLQRTIDQMRKNPPTPPLTKNYRGNVLNLAERCGVRGPARWHDQVHRTRRRSA